MIGKWFLRVLGVSAFVISRLSAFGQTINHNMVDTDHALEKHVSIPCGHYAVGELLELLTQQSSVKLDSGDPNDGGSGLEVTVCLRDVPLSEAMNDLYALLSFKEHEWRWVRIGRPGEYIYKLDRTQVAQNLSKDLKAYTQIALEKQATKLIAALHLSHEEMKKAAETANELKGLLESPEMQEGIRAFITLLSPDKQTEVLRGGEAPKFQVSQLDARGQEWVHNMWKATQVALPDGTINSTPEPTWIQFRTDSSVPPTRCMFIEIENQGGNGYFGGISLDKEFREYFANLWILPGDTAHSLLEQQTPKRESGIVIKDQARVMEERLGQLSVAMPLSFMARLPAEQRYDPHQIAGAPLEKFLNAFRGRGYELQSKWRGNTLLLTDDTLFLEDIANPDPAPWIVAKRVRSMRDSSQGVFAWNELVELSHDYDAAMLGRLGKEFPVATALIQCRELFRSFYRNEYRRKQLFSKEGLPILYVKDLLTSTPFAHLLEVSTDGKQPERIRATDERSTNGGRPCYTFRLESLDAKGDVLKKNAFYNEGK